MTRTRRDFVQPEIFEDSDAVHAHQPILMGIHLKYYKLIWSGTKKYEYRRRFIHGSSRWYTYVLSPAARLYAIATLAAPIVAPPLDIADVAEEADPGSGESVWRYLRGLRCGYAVPILSVAEYPGLARHEIADCSRVLRSPEGYIRLAHNPSLLETVSLDLFQAPTRVYDVESGILTESSERGVRENS